MILAMPPVRSEVVVPSSLQGPEREAFIDALYAVHASIFDGVDRDAFVHYVVDSPAEQTRIQVHRDQSGRIVGYFAFHMFRRDVRGQASMILRAESGILREFRGGASSLRFGFGEGIRHAARSSGMPIYYLGCLVHPTSYHMFCKYLHPVWPSLESPPDAALRALMSELGDSFGLERVGEDPLVRHVGWRTRDTEAERAFWQRCDKPDIRYYVEQNPGYGEGHGLLTLVRVTPGLIAGGLGRIAQEKGGHRLERLRARAQQLPLASRILLPREVRRRLRSVPLFEGLDDARLDALAARAEVVSHPAGRTLITQGELGEELFVIDSGAVHITASRSGEDVLLDQLDPGDVLGEIGVLGGEPRTASARTATRATLIRFGRRALLEAMQADPVLAESIWARYAERRFEYAAETHPALARTSRASRFAFLRQGTTIELATDQTHVCRGPGLVFVVRGEVAIEQPGTRIVGRAPLLLEIGDELPLRARSAAHLVELPPPPLPAAFAVFRPYPLLARLTDAELLALLHVARPVRLENDEPLFSAGDKADAFYLVQAGAVEIVLGGMVIRRLGTGECFGERGLDPSGPGIRTAGARTVGPTELLRVVGDAFRKLAGPAVFATSEPGRQGW
jgi:CRP-like cAMP-binding protein